MRVSEVEQELEKTPMGSVMMPYLAAAGLSIVLLAFVIYLNLSGTIADYYSNPKLIRDSAESGSDLLGQLQAIKSTGAWVLPFTFTGLALLLSAISASLTGIKKTLGLRAKVFEDAVPKLAKKR